MTTSLLSQSIALFNGPENVGILPTNPTYNSLPGLVPSQYAATAVNVLLGAAGVLSFLFLLWGGTQWITAGGDKDAVEKARKRIIGALIGLAAVFSAYALIYIIQVLFNISIIRFGIGPLGH